MQTRYSWLLLLLWASSLTFAFAQDVPPPPPEDDDFEAYGDAGEPPKTFATQKVLFLTPTKLISVGYESQLPFDYALGEAEEATGTVARYGGLRLGANFPVVSRSNFVLNLGVNYWETAVGLEDTRLNPNLAFIEPRVSLLRSVNNLLERGLRSTGINATVFKPFNNRNFLIVQAQADVNGTYRNLSEVYTDGLTFSGTAIYGWKKNDSLMWGVGVTRTYRAGQVLHIPVVFLNRTWNQRWGLEMILPARAAIRRNFGTTSLLTLGYEIEGNAYYLGRNEAGNQLFLRRGELKPRLTYERQLSGFIWVSTQVGYRHDWRFDVDGTLDPEGDDNPLLQNSLDGAFYFNVSLNLVSP